MASYIAQNESIRDELAEVAEFEAANELVVEPDDDAAMGYHRFRLYADVAAGSPAAGPRGPDEIDVPEDELLQVPGSQFGAVRLHGDSLDEELPDGSIAIFTPHGYGAGDMVVVTIHDGISPEPEQTVKRYVRRGGMVRLFPCSSNPEHEVLELMPERVEIHGRVVLAKLPGGQWQHVLRMHPRDLG